MNLIDIVFAAYNTTQSHKDILVRYHTQLHGMEKVFKDRLISIYGSSDEGPAISALIFLVLADRASFLRFSTYLHDIAFDMEGAIKAGELKVGSRYQDNAAMQSLRAYAVKMRINGMNVAADTVFDIEPVMDYISLVLAFLHFYRCCLAPYDELDFYDGSKLRGWLTTCGIPLIQPLALNQPCYH